MSRSYAPRHDPRAQQRGGGQAYGRRGRASGPAPSPAPRRKSSGAGFISFLFSFLVLAGAFALVGGFAFHAEASRPGPATELKSIVIPHGGTAASIGDLLEREGEVRNAIIFRIASRIYTRGTLQAGEYAIPAHASVADIVRLIAEGHSVQHGLTIPEGLTVSQAMEVIAASDVLGGPMPAPPPEGALLPETYSVERGMTRAAVLQQMMEARNRTLNELWANRAPDLPLRTPEEAVILASIVERETGMPAERPHVAAVFINRLRLHMALQSDPTIIYGVCLRAPTHCAHGRLVNERGEPRVIRESEIAMNTGYNTYQIVGLPPTPIANPGRASLEAVLHPLDSRDLYFVANGTGGHVFAATVAEHNANVARWREIEHQRLAQEAANEPHPAPPPQTHAHPRRRR